MPLETSVLIVRTGAMGDVLHALPAVASLRALAPDASIGWVVDPRWAPLLVNGDGVGPVVSRVHLAETRLWSQAPVSRRTIDSVLVLRRELQQEHYGTAADMQGTLRSAVLGRLAGTASFSGYADPRERAAKLWYRQRLRRQGTHVVEQGASLLGEALGQPVVPGAVMLPYDRAAEDWAEELLARSKDLTDSKNSGNSKDQPLALLAPTAGWGAKQWPAARFAALARALRAQGFAVLVNASHPEEPVARLVVEASVGGAQMVVCGIPALVALLRRTALLVGGDSGPVHLAAALGRPVVALYGPTDPARNGPWGPGPVEVLRHPASATSYRRRSAVDPGLLKIEVDEVLRAALRVASS